MNSNNFVLVTGGAGYIGSHTVIELIENGYFPVVVDNRANISNMNNGDESQQMVAESIKRIKKITGKEVCYHNFNMLDKEKLNGIFTQYKFLAVMHFAGLKSVSQSISNPLAYYEINLGITLNLIECMQEHNVKQMVFSSSATVYGVPTKLPISEDHPVGKNLTNPYGKTKFFIEEILQDLTKAEKGWKICLLRFFNPVGSHSSGLIGEDPQGPPNNLMPYVAQVAVGSLPFLTVYGNDYETKDGTGARDYVHVVDVAKGHVAALKRMEAIEGCVAINLGTGKGTSVLEAVEAFEKASGKKIAYKFAPRRPGDVGDVHANPSFAEKFLNWKATKSFDDMCVDLWRWQTMNPNGYLPASDKKS